MSVHYKCKNENQGKLRESIRNNEISIVSGLPGTGKTYIACAEALKLIKSKSKYKKILLVKSITQLRGEELGSLPGDLNEKFDPYLGSFIDNFENITKGSILPQTQPQGGSLHYMKDFPGVESWDIKVKDLIKVIVL